MSYATRRVRTSDSNAILEAIAHPLGGRLIRSSLRRPLTNELQIILALLLLSPQVEIRTRSQSIDLKGGVNGCKSYTGKG